MVILLQENPYRWYNYASYDRRNTAFLFDSDEKSCGGENAACEKLFFLGRGVCKRA